MDLHYAVVLFTAEENAPGVICSKWLNSMENETWYPNVDTNFARDKLLRKMSIPDESWKRCDVKILKKYKTMIEAQRALARAEETSNLSSEDEEEMRKNRGRRKKKRLFSDDDDDQMSNDEQLGEKERLPIRKKEVVSFEYPSPTSVDFENETCRQHHTPQTSQQSGSFNAHTPQSSQPSKTSNPNTPQTSQQSSSFNSHTRLLSQPSNTSNPNTPQTSQKSSSFNSHTRLLSQPSKTSNPNIPQTTSFVSPVHQITNKFNNPHRTSSNLQPRSSSLSPNQQYVVQNDRKILHQLQMQITDVIEQQKRIESKLDMLLNKSAMLPEDSTLDVLNPGVFGDLPCKSLENFEELERNLQDEHVIKQLVRLLATLGGKDLKHCVNVMMRRIMADDLAMEFSYSGKSTAEVQKISFSKYAACKCIQVAARRLFKEASEMEIKNCISAWLQQAKFRVTRRKKGGVGGALVEEH